MPRPPARPPRGGPPTDKTQKPSDSEQTRGRGYDAPRPPRGAPAEGRARPPAGAARPRPPRDEEAPRRPARAAAGERPSFVRGAERPSFVRGAERPTRAARPAPERSFSDRSGSDRPGSDRSGPGRDAPRPTRGPRAAPAAEAPTPFQRGPRRPTAESRDQAPERPAARPAPAPRFVPTRTARAPMAPRQQDPDAPQPRAPRPVAAAPPPETFRAPSTAYWLYGLHAVESALRNTARRAHRLLLTADAEATLTSRLPPDALTRARVTPERADRQRFQTFLTEDAVHQGAAMLVEPLPNPALEKIVTTGTGPVVLLDQVTDPRNVGAILRSAAAFGAVAVVLQSRHAPPETGAMARAASGALDIVPVVREVNLSRAIQSLQRLGFWVVGMAGDAPRSMAEAGLGERRIALVLGAEDAGLRRLQRETCDELVRLPMAEGVESLNVSAAAAVALYEIARR
ncbi:23S rRNA (guanosine2251-2'-O)-methyltransferase [Humitalea rosea]|uniref:23S rRNA (Guanosine2251-2'-O)-methyltransferase n=1 Tax=Humitalea rosea TaxID=990373 RepID=A0A2W7IMW8_9PROT|nr:23S rRNA (guanosine(2251)-2'-O)-methyltransferase RlmB [Humitalea rosea]PZW39973.1 23S rRNA (guanosine2251-2'-O)-methyltransferase [Humitalea rosea]